MTAKLNRFICLVVTVGMVASACGDAKHVNGDGQANQSKTASQIGGAKTADERALDGDDVKSKHFMAKLSNPKDAAKILSDINTDHKPPLITQLPNNWVTVQVDATTTTADLDQRLAGRPGILDITIDAPLELEAIPNDPDFAPKGPDADFGSYQWALQQQPSGDKPTFDIKAPDAWNTTAGDTKVVTAGDPKVVVAVIDSGFNINHPDLKDNIWTNPHPGSVVADIVDDVHGWNFAGNNNDLSGDVHGTHVAGIIAARGDNGIGVAGVAWQSTLMPLKVGSSFGATSQVIRAIDYAAKAGAKVINMSKAHTWAIPAEKDAIDAVGKQGVLFVNAAGNAIPPDTGQDNDVSPHFPGNFDSPNIISVANLTPQGTLHASSNYGAANVDLAAPGTDILSTWFGDQYGAETGTSMAGPVVAGVVALILVQRLAEGKGLPQTLQEAVAIKDRILNSTTDAETLKSSCRVLTGGYLNAAAALDTSRQWPTKVCKHAAAGPGQIRPLAGSGMQARYPVEDGPAVKTALNAPKAVALDTHGNSYIADANRILEVTDGTIQGFMGAPEGQGLTLSAKESLKPARIQLAIPQGVAVDTAGNFYIADTVHDVVLRVTDGMVSLFAGKYGKWGGGFSGDGHLAVEAELSHPTGIAVDSAGNVYIADTYNSVIRKVTDGVITTIAGKQSKYGGGGFSGDKGPAVDAELASPNAVAVDAAGNVYIADTGNNRIRKVTGGVIDTIAGGNYELGDGGPAIDARLKQPKGVAVDAAGNVVYIADTGHNRIRKVTGGVITTIAGDGEEGSSGDYGPATQALLKKPLGVTVQGNMLAIVDSGNHRVRTIQLS